MKITFEIDDNNVVADAMDAVVLSYLKSSKAQIIQWKSTHEDDIEQDRRFMDALDIVIEYYGGSL